MSASGKRPVAAQSGHVIEDEGTPLAARAKLNFIGAGVTATDNAGADATDVTINTGSAPDADGSTKGLVQLAGDLAGTAASPQIAAGAIVNADINAAAAIAESKLSLASDAAAGTASRRTLGTGATQAAAGNDSRLSDTRTPTDASVTAAKLAAALLDTDGTLAANSDSKLASQKAVKTYVDANIGGAGATGPLHRRMASPNRQRGRTLSADFSNQGLTRKQFDLLGTNDVQTLAVTGGPTSGSLTLTGLGITVAVPFNAKALQVQALLQQIYGGGNVACSGGPLPGASIVITFQGDYGSASITPLTVNASGLTGGSSPSASITHTTTGGGGWTFTTDPDDGNRPCIAMTDWLTQSSIIAKPGYVMGDVDSHARLKIPTGGAHASVTLQLFNRYVDPNNGVFTTYFSPSNVVQVCERTVGSTSTPRSFTTVALAAGYWHIRYKTIGPVHLAKWWPESGDEPDWQIVVVRGDLSTGWLELGVPALTAQFAASSDGSVPVLITDLTWTEELPAGEDIGWNGDFRINDSVSGLPIGWILDADGAHGTTTFQDVTIDGVARRAVVMERTLAGGGGCGITLNLYARNGLHGTPRFPPTIPEWARYVEITITHKMENIAHSGADTFLAASTSMYYDDIKSGGLNTIGGPGGGAQTDYYAGWGPTGVVGGQGATGGVGSTGGFVRESSLIPLHPSYSTDEIAPKFTFHDPDVTGKWTIADIEIRAIA